MISLALFLAVAALVWMLAAWRAPLWLWTVLVGLGVGVCSLFGSHTPAVLIVAWRFFLAVALVFNAPIPRRRLVSNYLLQIFRRVLPPMSDTEREALEAGSVWWEAELFRGDPRWQKLLDIPAARLSARRSRRFWMARSKNCAGCSTTGTSRTYAATCRRRCGVSSRKKAFSG